MSNFETFFNVLDNLPAVTGVVIAIGTFEHWSFFVRHNVLMEIRDGSHQKAAMRAFVDKSLYQFAIITRLY